jgi:hypothetical protein
VGATQYVQIVNEGLQVFDKSTQASLLGPVGITTLWNGFGGVCQNAGDGDPKLWRYHVDFATPANSTFTLGGNLTPAGYTELCPTSRSCVPQAGTTSKLDGLADRGMFRLAYRNFGDHEALVGNQTVSSNGVAGIRWYEINHATSGTPAFTQQSAYQPDTTWRWMGSAAMDESGDLAVGFSASSASISPQIRYAGRLAGDPPNMLAQGEATLFSGIGSQTGTSNRWGDYSDMTVDPVDNCTFWYTNEYYSTTSCFNCRTRIGTFSFPGCGGTPPPSPPPPPPPPPPPTQWTLTVTTAGAGNGTVTSSPAGINCGSTCVATYNTGTAVTLTARAAGRNRSAAGREPARAPAAASSR